ncbi:MAG TPA: mechanosensitive ion channel protein MscS [candidate division Zixibacteria bacterium]|jgi:small-conductance mechanosensitive channel|nr:mechanosensitive ion channel protein MscS [candidate division Zixibacteria bacterium]
MFQEFINQTFLGNRVQDYAVSLAMLAGLALLVKLADLIFIARLKAVASRTDNKYDDWLVAALDKRGVPLLYLGAVYLSLRHLALSHLAQRIVNISVGIVLAYLAVRLASMMIERGLAAYGRKKGGKEASPPPAMRGLMGFAKFFLWLVAALILLDNVGFKVSALVAGLGIGGLAVAFAAQKVLGDLFSYFSIFFDRPFEIGDFIVVGEFRGTVEHIGLKSTRIRSLSGEQLIFSNTDLTSSRLCNYKRMVNRRVAFKIGVTYQTGAAKVRQIPGIIEKIIRDLPGAVFDRAHFASYGDFSLIFEVVYFVEGGDYLKYMDIQQRINLSLMEAFARKKINFAYPTQTVYVGKA